MTLYEFKSLDLPDQATAVWEYRVHIATRYILRETVLLWQLEGFYVGVFYDGVEIEISKIQSFLSTLPFEPYLKQIELNELH